LDTEQREDSAVPQLFPQVQEPQVEAAAVIQEQRSKAVTVGQAGAVAQVALQAEPAEIAHGDSPVQRQLEQQPAAGQEY
jgi:hypothetical protein